MEISPAVQPPKVGDPITAKWASDLAAAVNSCANPAERLGEAATPYGKAAQSPGLPMLGRFDAPMYFDCRVAHVSGVDKIYCCLPPPAAIWGSVVFVNQNPVDASPNQTLGTMYNPWVEIGSVASGPTYVFLAFEDISGASERDWHFYWRLGVANAPGGDYYPTWASLRAPLIPVARIAGTYVDPDSAIPGVNQLWRGSICIGGASWSLGGTEISAWGKSVGNSSKAQVLDLDARQFSGGTWEAASGNMKFGSHTLAPVSVTINGVSYTVLGKKN